MMHAYATSSDCRRGRCGTPRTAPSRAASHPLALVHQTVGNRAVARAVLQRTPAAPAAPTFAPNCNEFHRCNVIEGLTMARTVVDGTIAALTPIAAGTVTTGSVVTRLTTEFHDPDAKGRAALVLAVYRLLRTELDAAIRFNCDSEAGDCTSAHGGVVGAYTNCAAGAEIGLCSAFHVVGCAEQVRFLIHEYAHHLPGFCADLAYSDQPAFATLTAAQAMVNADSFAFFAVNVSSPAGCVDCGTVIQIGGPRRRRY